MAKRKNDDFTGNRMTCGSEKILIKSEHGMPRLEEGISEKVGKNTVVNLDRTTYEGRGGKIVYIQGIAYTADPNTKYTDCEDPGNVPAEGKAVLVDADEAKKKGVCLLNILKTLEISLVEKDPKDQGGSGSSGRGPKKK